MSSIRLLALSSSRTGGSAYLEAAAPLIRDLLGDTPLQIAFIPFAAVDRDYAPYGAMVEAALAGLSYTIHTVQPDHAKETIAASDGVMVGGGNTFKLLHHLYQYDLLNLIRSRVNGGTPYIGWSAGANIAGHTIATTNDMPIIEPPSFQALNLLPFQINPHYINLQPAGYHGETRDQRLAEFTQLNPGVPVLCLPEGTALRLDGETLKYLGEVAGMLLQTEKDTGIFVRQEIPAGADVSFLMRDNGPTLIKSA